ncbi:MAG TPA: quinolinate synthase NadA [Alphaproteobacteria bacterium]|nr:quinolinate synthase NadA [Alphaproteobacteria bacterium]
MTEALAYTEDVAKAMAPFYRKVERVMPAVEWPFHAPYVAAINRLKKEKNAVILAHNYQTPEIYHCVADIVGDSLQLAYEAQRTSADIIVLAGVYFMAETAKLLNPSKTVLIPDVEAGCSLATSITGADVRLMRERYPGVPVAAYVNSTAEVKAESDICITSSNAVRVIESLGAEKVICLPDEFLAKYVAQNTKVQIIAWKGHCEVHERFTAKDIADFRTSYPDAVVLAHPECPPEVLNAADFVGSTSAMSRYVREKTPKRVVMVTECSMSDNVSIENPGVEFVRPCNLCPHMKRITLPKILDSLQNERFKVDIPAEIAAPARRAVERMLAVGKG